MLKYSSKFPETFDAAGYEKLFAAEDKKREKKEVVEFLRKWAPEHCARDLRWKVKDWFGIDLTTQQVRNLCKYHGIKPLAEVRKPAPEGRVVTLRMTDALIEAVDYLAAQRKCSRSRVIIDALHTEVFRDG